MRLLILTQVVDREDPVLGFFHRWVEEFAKHFETIIVICLKEGKHLLPANVRVLSLGKESGASRITYVARFFRYIWSERANYNAVFVHQNQEYVLLAGWFWKLLGKKIYMWRNHYAGSLLTDIASFFCDKIFCTSARSYTARFKNAVQMPVGVDTELFKSAEEKRIPRSILFLGRMAPSKRPDMLVEALGTLSARGVSFTTSFYGPTLPKDESYLVSLKRRISDLHLTDRVLFYGGVAHDAVPALYASHEIFVNLSGSGMYDKTLFEASASGCLIVAASTDFAELTGFPAVSDEPRKLASTLVEILELSLDEKARHVAHLRSLARQQSLETLANRLRASLDPSHNVVF